MPTNYSQVGNYIRTYAHLVDAAACIGVVRAAADFGPGFGFEE